MKIVGWRLEFYYFEIKYYLSIRGAHCRASTTRKALALRSKHGSAEDMWEYIKHFLEISFLS